MNEMENIKFSVLIPVYNVEKYLRQCIDSVLAQNYDNIEIILVDDGSTDSSGRICDEYAEKDSRIKVIHKKNEGLLSARRTAVKAASGDYFAFLDSDDYWEYDLLNTAIQTIENHNCDMIVFNYKKVYQDKTVNTKALFEDEKVFENEGKEELYKCALEGSELNNLVTKIVERDIVDVENDYKELYDVSYGEDALQSAQLTVNARKVVYLDRCMYNYRQKTGMTKSINASGICSVTKARAKITEIYKTTGFDLSESIEKELYNYLEDFAKYVLYGYLDNPKKLREALECVLETDFYKMAKETVYNKQSLFNKSIIQLAEKGHYKAILLIAYALKQRNRLKELRKK